jgi:hypothetical protein
MRLPNPDLSKEELKMLRKKYKIETIASMKGVSVSWIKTLLRKFKLVNKRS